MRFILSFFICYLLFAPLAHTQDTLYRTNGRIMPVHLIKVDAGNITYKQAGDTSSLIYIIDKAYVTKIVHQNGVVERYTQMPDPGLTQLKLPLDLEADTVPNRISINVFDLFFGLATFEYERVLSSGVFSLKVPLTVGLQWDYDVYTNPNNGYKQRLFRTGCGFYFHPGTFEKGKYSVGTSFEFGKNKDIEDYGGKYESIWVFSLLFNNGFNFMISRQLFISLDVGIGLGALIYSYTSEYSQFKQNYQIFDYKAGINFGYKF